MSEPLDWNANTIAEFRANEGRVGGVFKAARLDLMHHYVGKSARKHRQAAGSPPGCRDA